MMHRHFLRLGRRIGIAIAGGAVILAGVAMLALPGPGIVTILLGLAILSQEFERPRRWLAHLKARGLELKDRVLRKRPESAARRYFAFVLVLLAAMLFAAITSPWVHALLTPLSQFPLHRVFNRLMLLGMIAGTALILVFRYRQRRELLGFGRPWPQFLRRLLYGLIAGITLMLLAVAPLMLLDLRMWSDRFPADFTGWGVLALKALASGIVVAFLEETFFRGAMQGVLQRIGATRWALFAVPLLYSAVHFLGRAASVPHDEVNAWSGFVVLQGLFSSFAQPLRILDAFVALYFVGLLLALVRRHWGDIAGCIGLHAGFVTVIAAFRRISTPGSGNEWSFLVGAFDGLLGLWIATVTAVVCVVLWRFFRVKTA
jgi:membrane protease YdiL (CAAX protease family)